jgi:putative transposase
MQEESGLPFLSGVPETERMRAMDRFQVIRPFLEENVPLTQVAADCNISVRTAWYWVKRYRQGGLAALTRKGRNDKNERKLSREIQEIIEGLALQKPRLSAAAVQRKAIDAARERNQSPPSYNVVYSLMRGLDRALVTLAHEGAKAYSESFELVHRTEADGPNVIWQADHTELDILVKDEKGNARRPWLTIVLDDYSRAVAGYMVSLDAPSAIQTALALRQAIWRKPQAGWHVCGIPQILYTDHGSDFTSRHMEQVAADLKMRLVFSRAGRPRGRGKIERFFESLAQVLLSRLPGYARSEAGRRAILTLPELSRETEHYLVREYLATPHRTTGQAPQARWEAGGFLPQMPESLEKLDLLLLTVPQARRVHRDGIQFMGMRYIDPTLAAYVSEEVILRYDPRDMAEIRVFYKNRFLCRAVCQELAGETVPLRDIVRARDRQRRELRQTLEERRRKVDSLLEVRRFQRLDASDAGESPSAPTTPRPTRLKRYLHE